MFSPGRTTRPDQKRPALKPVTLISLISTLPLALSCASATAQTLSEQEAEADLAALYEGLETAQNDLFVHTPRSAFDQRYDELIRQIDGPVELGEFHEIAQRFAALARIAHTRIVTPHPDWNEHLETGRFFPLSLRVHEGEVIVTEAPADSPVQPGDRILSIDGQANPVWLARLTRNIAADTPALAYSQLEGSELYYFWLEYGEPDSFDIAYERQGERARARIAAASLDELRNSVGIENAFSLAGREARMVNQTIAYLRPGPFYNVDATTPEEAYNPEATRAFIAYIDAAYQDFIEAGAESLILDLRDNPGGDNSYSDPVIAWFADEPFRFASDFQIKVSESTIASNQARVDALAEGETSASSRLAELYAAAEPGETVSYEIPYAQPREGQRFDGEVYGLINRFSFSNAVSTGALIQDYGFGTIMGEPTTDMATTYGAMEHFTLPYSEFLVGYPKALIIRPNGERETHPLTPDVFLPAPAIRSEQDMMLNAAIAYIQERN